MANREETLRQVPLFAGVGDRQLRRLGEKLRERRFPPGTTVVREGEMSGIGFFVVVDGEAAVSAGGRERGMLGPGDSFGELGLIAERERTATVTARTPLDCLELTSWDFRETVQRDPELAWNVLQHVVTLLLDERGETQQPA